MTGTRELEIGTSTNIQFAPQGRTAITAIGIDVYTHWPMLHNAVSDARGVYELFVEKFGAHAPVPPLFDHAATKSAIQRLIDDGLRKALEPDDALILFFAGHGHTRLDKVGGKTVETGYLVPVEARAGVDEHWSDYLPIDSFLETIAKLPARHILVILDACRSGFALGSSLKVFRTSARYERDLANRLSRKVITSARRDQPALDGGPVAGHSLFTGTLIDGLNWGTADLDGNGIVTSSELGLFAQQRVGQASESRQTPDFGSFHFDDRGELILSLWDASFDALKARAFASLQQGELSTFDTLVEQVSALRPDSPEVLYLQLRRRLMAGDIERAIEAVYRLIKLDLSKGTIPLSLNDLANLVYKLPFWRNILALLDGETPLKVVLLVKSDGGRLQEPPKVVVDGRELYEVQDGVVAQFQITNLTDAPAHVYFLTVTPHGRLVVGALPKEGVMKIQGIPPNATAESDRFRVRGAPGYNETRIFYARQPIEPLLFPPTTASRELRAVSGGLLEDVRMKVIRFRVVDASMSVA